MKTDNDENPFSININKKIKSIKSLWISDDTGD